MPGEEQGEFGGGETTDVAAELKRWADMIKATTEAIAAVSNLLDAPRSVSLEVNNTTSQPLGIEGSGDHDWGTFRDPPPFGISPNTTAVFSSESNRPLTGTQGSVRFHVDDAGTIFHLEWNVPYVGGNEAHCRVEGTNAGWYIARSIPGGGNTKVQMRYMIGERARANKHSSPDWRFCGKCKSLFHELDEGRCRSAGIAMGPSDEQLDQMRAPLPGGLQPRRRVGVVGEPSPPPPAPPPPNAGTELFSQHEAQGYRFRLPQGVEGPNRESSWRKCVHCKRLFYDGEDSKGACPGRGGHVAEQGGLPFQIVYAVTPGPSQQDNWRFCDKCYGMFFLPANDDALCPAGGKHHALSESYVLDYQA